MSNRAGGGAKRARATVAAIGIAVVAGTWASIALAAGSRPHAGRARQASVKAARHAHRHSRAHAPRAHAAGKLHARDKAKLHYVGAVGEEVYETGRASGTLPGSMRVHMIFASTFRGRFTIYTRGGRIYGHGKAKPHGGGVYESFAGTLIVTGGSGRYRHAHGIAHLYGTFNRDNYALTIDTAGTLRF